MLVRLGAVAVLAVLSTVTATAQVAIDEIRVQMFRELSGALSENIAGANRSFVNAPRGAEGAEPADALLVTLAFTGAKNSRASDKIARDLAAVTVTQAAKTGPRVLLKRAYGGFLFGPDGRSHKAFLLDGATCAPLDIEVKVGRSRKAVRLDFACDG
jgi:hypothetical protein